MLIPSGRLFIIIIFVVGITGCTQNTKNSDDYQKGYEQGLEDGRIQTCNEIENAKDSIHSFLENEGICQ